MNGIKPGEMTVIAGSSGSGKSIFNATSNIAAGYQATQTIMKGCGNVLGYTAKYSAMGYHWCPYCKDSSITSNTPCMLYKQFEKIYEVSLLGQLPDFTENSHIEIHVRKDAGIIKTIYKDILLAEAQYGRNDSPKRTLYFDFEKPLRQSIYDRAVEEGLRREIELIRKKIAHKGRGEKRAKYFNDHGIYIYG